jgi:hypothetical protein
MLNDETPVSACMFFFGLTTLLQGFAQGFGGLVACRIFLGMFHINRNRQADSLILIFFPFLARRLRERNVPWLLLSPRNVS